MFIKIKYIFPALFISLSLISCGSQRTIADISSFDDLKAFAANSEFEIQNQWANPMRSGAISLVTNTNYIRMNKDSVSIYLPYFGVRQMGGGYGSTGGIEYDGIAKDLEILEKPNKEKIEIHFSVKNNTENLLFLITLYKNGSAQTFVTSSERDNISYSGKVYKLRIEE
ncbi:DUF4251 domain-containing protein [Zunongwangia sp.]|uniref:DUF4251 domain-containing protein n=1 Tax=Zunongwangia sp. TaxID=1965325 RepID=UPI003AA96369